jgi:purine-binding chemotaxis protein CheW
MRPQAKIASGTSYIRASGFQQQMTPAPAEFLTFAIDRQRFGIRIENIREIIRAVLVARLPKAPPVVEGLIDVRGTVVPVLDIRSRFGLSAKPVEPADHIVIARTSHRVVGLRVDCALDIRALAASEIEDIGTVAPAGDYVAGVAKLPDGLLLIHDLATFLSETEAHAVDAVVEAGIPA